MQSIVALVFCALTSLCVSFSAVASPIDTSVWINVIRANGVVFKGHTLPLRVEGMGVAVNDKEIFTAAHVVWEAKVVSITTSTGQHVNAVVVGIDADTDSAVLRVWNPLPQFSMVRQKPVATGEAVRVVTNLSLGENAEIFSGNIGATKWTSNGVSVPLIFSGIKGEKGMSGGGLYDATDQLVGIIVRIDNTLGYLSALPIGELCKRFTRCALVK